MDALHSEQKTKKEKKMSLLMESLIENITYTSVKNYNKNYILP